MICRLFCTIIAFDTWVNTDRLTVIEVKRYLLIYFIHRIHQETKVGGKVNMSKTTNQIRNLTMMALFVAIEIVLLVTPFGYLRIGPLSATLMHVPVIVCACIMSTQFGALLGLVFGVTSVINATMAPTVTSFAFSPFVEIAGFQGGMQSLIIAIVPRVLLGCIAGCIFHFLAKKNTSKTMAAALGAGIATFLHTLMVLGLIIIFYAGPYANAIGIASSALMAYMGSILLTNMIPEIIVAVLVNIALVKALTPVMKKY